MVHSWVVLKGSGSEGRFTRNYLEWNGLKDVLSVCGKVHGVSGSLGGGTEAFGKWVFQSGESLPQHPK